MKRHEAIIHLKQVGKLCLQGIDYEALQVLIAGCEKAHPQTVMPEETELRRMIHRETNGTVEEYSPIATQLVEAINSLPHIVLPSPEELAKKLLGFGNEIAIESVNAQLGTTIKWGEDPQADRVMVEAMSRLLNWIREQK